MIVAGCIVGYLFGSVLTGFYIRKVSDARNWSSADTDGAQIFSFVFWPAAWLIMLAWIISKKIGVPR